MKTLLGTKEILVNLLLNKAKDRGACLVGLFTPGMAEAGGLRGPGKRKAAAQEENAPTGSSTGAPTPETKKKQRRPPPPEHASGCIACILNKDGSGPVPSESAGAAVANPEASRLDIMPRYRTTLPRQLRPFIKFTLVGQGSCKGLQCENCSIVCSGAKSLIEHFVSRRHARKVATALCATCKSGFVDAVAFARKLFKANSHCAPHLSTLGQSPADDTAEGRASKSEMLSTTPVGVGLQKHTMRVDVKASYSRANAHKYARRSDIEQTQTEMTVRALQLLGLDVSTVPKLNGNKSKSADVAPSRLSPDLTTESLGNGFTRRRGLVILDIGCGSGMSSTIPSALGHVVVGCDLSADMLREALEPSAESGRPKQAIHGVAQCDLGHGLPWRSGSFDAAVSISAVQWLATAGGQVEVNAEHEDIAHKNTHKGTKTASRQIGDTSWVRHRWMRMRRFFCDLRRCLSGKGARAVLQVRVE